MNFKKRASEIYAHGVERRGNYTPTGTPLRLYKYWANNNPAKVPDKENFCHYWRVVVFWSLITFLRNTGKSLIESRVFQTVVAVSLFAAGAWAFSQFDTFREVLLAIGVGLALSAIFIGSGFLIAKGWTEGATKRTVKAINFVGSVLDKAIPVFFIGVAFVAPVVVYVYQGWAGVGLMAAILAAAMALTVSTVFLVGYFDEKQDRRTKARWKYEDDYFNEHGKFPPRVDKEPGRFTRFLVSAADFVVLAFQIVRVKKWKICPMVEVPK